ncbi:MAG: alpha-L-glutamate ligase-like protein [Deltaproteobacteria bacterium]|nr:MAG: alpha-L-glutamate ligase-like protein [Deltaproteobacteria bacterium]
MIAALRRIRSEVLGINRRNHGYLFAYNPRARYRVVDDKQATKVALAAGGVRAPSLRHVCEAQWQVRRLAARLAAEREFVLKPARGAGGAGIVVVVGRRGDRFVKASGATLRARDLEAHACDVLAGAYSPGGRADRMLVEELVVPEPVLGAFSYRGVPDVRVLVFRGVPVLAMVRLPTRRSDGRANLHLGGVGVGVDLASGCTTFAIQAGHPVRVHPDLGRMLTGVAVPAWPEVLDLAVRAADAVGLGFLGVDVVLDERHGPLVLELNARPGLGIQMANRRGLRPLLERVARASLPVSAEERVALGRALAYDCGSSR